MCAHATRVFAVWPLRSLSARSRSPLLRSPNQRRIWRQLVRVVIACLSISSVRRRGRGLRSVHGELRRAYRAFITCWQTETGLLLPTGMLPAPCGLAPNPPPRRLGRRAQAPAKGRRALAPQGPRAPERPSRASATGLRGLPNGPRGPPNGPLFLLFRRPFFFAKQKNAQKRKRGAVSGHILSATDLIGLNMAKF